jgi:asparagine N-glycosylation enzyme membrane subunit Stt3
VGKALARYFSFAFHGLLAIILIAVSGVALVSGQALSLEVLPWTGATLIWVVFLGSLCGLATVALAYRRKLSALFFVWSVVVAVLLFRGYVFGGYYFDPGDLGIALFLTAASLVSLAGAWWQMRAAVEIRKRY